MFHLLRIKQTKVKWGRCTRWDDACSEYKVILTLYIKEKGKYFKWSDPWNSIEGNIKGDEVECNYHGEDTIHVAINRVPKKFLFFRFGTKYVEVNMVNSNPSSIITYNKTIRMKK